MFAGLLFGAKAVSQQAESGGEGDVTSGTLCATF